MPLLHEYLALNALPAALLDRACAPYRPAGRFAWRFARGKLGGDPAFQGLLRHGLIPDQARVLDLGCGQGLLASWLMAARALYEATQKGEKGGAKQEESAWPTQWPAPPHIAHFHGIELMPREVARASAALAPLKLPARITQGDICETPFEPCDAVVILDVLHYIDIAAQDAVLTRVREALSPHGVLLLRVGDASAGLPFMISNWVDHVVTFVRRHRVPRLYCRSLSEWQAVLRQLGFQVRPMPMSTGTPFANVLLVAQLG
ncbi:MAG: class I SAM-dependent methyltransferase [Burkholderiales bacterium]|nr:class I SAM-dependent methyltransferase [Burkholderiales bacterium]